MKVGVLARSIVLSVALANAPARAAWLEATTDHFVIDATSSEERLRDFATKLERFDAGLRALWKVEDDPASNANRVRIFAANSAVIQSMSGPNVGGFYINTRSGPVIVTAQLAPPPAKGVEIGSLIPTIRSEKLDAQSTLFHEYSHHFMFESFPRAYPMWFTEGSAEFDATAFSRPDGTMVFGAQPPYRVAAFAFSAPLPMKDLFAPPKMLDLDIFYARAWLLTHDLLVEGHRQDQLARYFDAVGQGKDSLAAAKEAFGDIDQLGRELDQLANKGSLTGFVVDPGRGRVAVTIQQLSPGAAAMMPATIRAEAGHGPLDAAVVAEAEQTGRTYAGDARVQAEVARIELDAGRLDQADAAADRALAAAPKDVTALLVKGRVAMRRLTADKSADKPAWSKARAWFVRANNSEPNAAEPLTLYYQSFAEQEARAPDVAYQGLLRAQQLAPDVPDVSLLVASRLLDDGNIASARATLAPLAFSPHGNNDAARKAIEALDAGRRDVARELIAATSQ